MVNPLQRKKAAGPIDVTDEGIATVVNPLQSAKAQFPIEVTDEGIVKTPIFEVGH